MTKNHLSLLNENGLERTRERKRLGFWGKNHFRCLHFDLLEKQKCAKRENKKFKDLIKAH